VIGTVAMWGRVIEHTKAGAPSSPTRPVSAWSVCGAYGTDGSLASPTGCWTGAATSCPRCEEHAAQPKAVGRSFEVRVVENEMLDAYGVELLPVELLSPRA